jgi:sn-glycerol 3-phosphate transport system ATP-binding protein
MALNLKVKKLPKAEVTQRVQQVATMLRIDQVLKRKPGQLSGGQRQRVAMGRAIVRAPQVFLFDEPLSNLDAKLRVQMRLEIQKMHRALGTTSLYVTHDQVEAMTLGQRMIVMNGGRAEQIGTPADVYGRPATTFVASFIGSPPMNLLRGKSGAPGGFQLDGNGMATLPAGVAAPTPAECILGVRPEHLKLGQPGIAMEVEMVESLGADLLVHGRAGSQGLVIRTPAGTAVSAGQQVSAGFDASSVHWFDAATTQRLN